MKGKSTEGKRTEALSIFQKLPMPSPKEESWKYTDVRDLNLQEFGPAAQKIEFPGLSDELKEKGVIFTDIKTAVEKHKELMEDHEPLSLISPEEDKFTAMHGAFWNDGVFIYVPRNVSLKMPLRNIFRGSGSGGVFSHTLIILEEGAGIDYIEEHYSEKFEGVCLRNDAVEIFAGPNSRITFHNFQKWEDNVMNFTYWKARLAKDARVNWILGQFGGKFSRVKIDSFFDGPGSESKNLGVFYGSGEQHFDFTTNVHHLVPNTTADILMKGVLDGKASSVYRGKIKIAKIAQGTNSYLSDHSLILSNGAVSHSIPSLEIDANDVKASHGATLGKPDEEEIFYLMSRGLRRKEAERQIILGYFSPVTDNIMFDDLREKFNEALHDKVRG
ncbi:TPA: Fe-S cluster assembly protein SufD [Candidatus Woesearchaeota archaeon]|nr:Fe-S cluster assembly protein SufD [archaeon GW2011_AR15]MBS3103894.1 Fe-S cluster assembly protein SufD [Candidatus Woesearchaeota archaeon]HIH41629.1 Fe-S cluster assembly protein SufD [Candidatus Woesearchaeota archaeon]